MAWPWPSAKAKFKGFRKLNSGLPLALSQGQARTKLIQFINFAYFGWRGAGLRQAKTAEFSELNKLSYFKTTQ